MHSAVLSLAFCASTAFAIQGFNYGAVKIDGSIKVQSDFKSEFSTAKSLTGTNSAFTNARLYTTIQAGSIKDPISAIPAAIDEGTGILLGMWASSGQTIIDNEIAALTSAIQTYGKKFTSLVIGLSMGSEDLYRITPTGLANDPLSVGAGPAELVKYIQQVRDAVKGTDLEGLKIGHVDTWTGWVNGSNSAVVDAVDWLGMNTFPYYQTTDPNGIENGKKLFQEAYDATVGAGKGKPVWVTETGWPVSGKKSGDAEASTTNAKAYYDAVGCALFGKITTFYYTLVDANTDPTQPEFGVVGTTLSNKPLYDLSCDKANAAAASSSSKAATATSSGASSSGTGSAGSSSGTSSSSSERNVVTSTFTASPSNTGSGTKSGSAASATTSGSTSGTSASPSTSTTTKPNAAAALMPASVGGLVGAFIAILALF